MISLFTVIDAWGKPPPAILMGNFKWGGDIEACEEVVADRRNVQQDGTIIIEQGGLKGAWAMVAINITGPLGGVVSGFVNTRYPCSFCVMRI